MANPDALMEPPQNSSEMAQVLREAIYIPAEKNHLFGWYHSAEVIPQKNCVAVVCSPIGYEYAHSHRSMRHLSDQLARSGIPAFRFDYWGVGDSPGGDLDSQPFVQWQSDAVQVIKYARERSGCSQVCLIGVRLGATIAALAATEVDVNFLVLWCPCITGRRFLRETKALATTGAESPIAGEATLESGGFVFSREMVEALQAVDMLRMPFLPTTRVLVVDRDDMSPDPSLNNYLKSVGVDNQHMALPGFTDMMLEPHQTQVPHVAITALTNWLAEQTLPNLIHGSQRAALPQSHSLTQLEISSADPSKKSAGLVEKLCQFGTDRHLFGVLTQPKSLTDRPAIVIYNAGCQHRVGPNRLYVTLARALGESGFVSFRIDLEGIGDSVVRGTGQENQSYPISAASDASAAIQYLSETYGCKQFVLLGLCSGAHTAFHAGIDITKFNIRELVLINPLTFHWVEGLSNKAARQNFEAAHYKKSVTDRRAWRKLLGGGVNVLNLVKIVKWYIVNFVRSRFQSICEFLHVSTTLLSRDIGQILSLDRTITLVIAEGDPGYDILLAGARRITTKELKTGRIRMVNIPNADHTFSQFENREVLVKKIKSLLTSKYV